MTPHEDGEFLDRLWGNVHVNPATQCWEHQGHVDTGGYVQLGYKGKYYYAHRVALELKLGRPIAEGLCTRHSCHKRRCVFPQHLSEGTRLENHQDMVNAGRRVNHYGLAHGNAWLSDDEVREIKRLLVERRHTHQEIADMFNVSRTPISHINLGKTRADVFVEGFVPNTKPKAKLTVDDVLAIKQQLANGVSCRRLAEQFGMAPGTIMDIKAGRSWKDIELPEPKTFNRRGL